LFQGINQIQAFLIEQGITVRKALRALKNSVLTILDERKDEMSPWLRTILTGLHDDCEEVLSRRRKESLKFEF